MHITIPLWPDPASPDGQTLFARARKLHALYRAAGHPNPFAFGMLGCAEGENEDLDPNGMGDYVDEAGKRLSWAPHPVGTPTSFGLYQRKEARTVAIRDGHKNADGKITAPGLGIDIKALVLSGQNTLENEVRATLWEFSTFPLGYGAAAITAQRSAYGVAMSATISFEKAGTVSNGEAERRGTMAETWVLIASGIWPPSRGPKPDGWEALSEGWVNT